MSNQTDPPIVVTGGDELQDPSSTAETAWWEPAAPLPTAGGALPPDPPMIINGGNGAS